MSFLMKNDKLLVQFDEIWEKVRNSINKEFVYNEKYLRTKIRS